MIDFDMFNRRGTSVGQRDSTKNESGGMVGPPPAAPAGGTPGVPGGVGGLVAGLLTSIFSGDGAKLGGEGLGMLGDFDLDSFLESTLKKHQGGGGKDGDGGGIGKIIASLFGGSGG